MAKYQSTLTGQQIDAALSDMAARNSEAYATGKRNGQDVGSSDPTYHNNSKWYSEQAANVVANLSRSVVLTASGWDSSGVQTVSCEGVTGSNTVFVTPAPSSITAYASKGVVCVGQTTSSLTFECASTPSVNLTVNILIFG